MNIADYITGAITIHPVSNARAIKRMADEERTQVKNGRPKRDETAWFLPVELRENGSISDSRARQLFKVMPIGSPISDERLSEDLGWGRIRAVKQGLRVLERAEFIMRTPEGLWLRVD